MGELDMAGVFDGTSFWISPTDLGEAKPHTAGLLY